MTIIFQDVEGTPISFISWDGEQPLCDYAIVLNGLFDYPTVFKRTSQIDEQHTIYRAVPAVTAFFSEHMIKISDPPQAKQ